VRTFQNDVVFSNLKKLDREIEREKERERQKRALKEVSQNLKNEFLHDNRNYVSSITAITYFI